MTVHFDVVFQHRAKIELYDALEWYSEKSPKTAENFSKDIDKTVSQILLSPTRWRNSKEDFREIPLSKFPFDIVYSIDEEAKAIVIVSVFHHKRHPDQKFK